MTEAYGVLAGHYSLLFPLNDRQRDFFGRLLAARPAASVVDVGCGTGEHLSWFTARGLRAYGLEPDAAMFRELQRRVWEGTAPTLLPAGAEALPGAIPEKVDLALCLGNTLPHLPDRGAVQRAVRAMAAALAPQGRLVVQTVNFDRILAEGRAAFPPIERALPGGGRVSLLREYDLAGLPERVVFKTRLATPAGEHSAAWPLVPLRRDDLERHLAAAGLTDVAALGDYDGAPFAVSSPALILVSAAAPKGATISGTSGPLL